MLVGLLRAYLRPYRRPITAVVVLQLFSTIATLYLPTLNAEIIDNGVVKGDTSYILGAGGVMLAVSVVQMACSVGAVYFGSRTAMAFGRDLRREVFGRVQEFSQREFGRFGTPSLITRTTNDVQQVQMLALLSFTLMVSAPIVGVGSIILALNQNVPLSGLLVIVVPLLGIIVSLIVSRMRPLFRLMQGRIDRVNQVLREQISGVRVIRAFVRDDFERSRFAVANDDLFTVGLGVGRLMGLMFPSVILVIQLASIATLWFGGHLINDGSMQIGALTAFLSYLVQVLMAVMMATFMFVMVPRAEACAERIEEVLGTEPSVLPALNPVPVDQARGLVQISGVEFRYPGAEEPVLRGVNLEARPGEVTAVIGSTGSGKTTLLNLITRLFDATAGKVTIDGIDVRRVDEDALSGPHRPGPAAALPFLRHGGLQPALREPAGLRRRAVEGARDRPSPCVRRGHERGLSSSPRSPKGGPTSRGGSARGWPSPGRSCTVPGIYLFDDSFSALDYGTDAALRAALADDTAGATVLIVAQRVSTIRHADQIIVLEAGARSWARAPTTNSWRPTRPTARSSFPSSPRRRRRERHPAARCRRTPRTSAPRRVPSGFGPRAMLGGGPAEQLLRLRPVQPSAIARARPRTPEDQRCLGLGAASVALSVLGPRLARRRHQPYLFAVSSPRNSRPGRPRPKWWPGCAVPGPRHAGLHARFDEPGARPGVDFGHVGQVLLLCS